MSTTVSFAAKTKGSPVGQKMKDSACITSVVFVFYSLVLVMLMMRNQGFEAEVRLEFLFYGYGLALISKVSGECRRLVLGFATTL